MRYINDDFRRLEAIRKHIPFINISQADVIWLVSTLDYYMTRYQDLEKERNK